MKRLAALVSTLIIIFVIAFLVWSGRAPTGQTSASSQSLNLPPRPLTSTEQTAFLSLVCAKASGPGGGFAHQCESLPGYPSSDYGGAGLGLGITLQDVVFGHLTSATSDEAYVTYTGSFEPHAANYGGGILFIKDTDHWKLKAWYPGGQANGCVLLSPTGRARFVCLSSWEGQGEADSSLTLTTLPPAPGNHPTLLSARDLRDTLNPNANCQGLPPGQNIALAINNLVATPDGAEATISYVRAASAQTACAANQFANAPVSTATLALHWHDGRMKLSPALHLVSTP